MVPGQKQSSIQLDDIPTIYETMAGLHSIIGKQALQNITDADLKLLSEINDDFQYSIEKKTQNKL